MSTQQTKRQEQARRYINEVIAINRSFGMDGDVPEDVYNEAVEEAANAFKGLVSDPA